MKRGNVFICLALFVFVLTRAEAHAFSFSSASDIANEEADKRMYQEQQYRNVHKKGPKIIIMPGEIKSNNATFRQQISQNNIKDFAEIELTNANFTVLERADLNPLLDEQKLAYEMGSVDAGEFKRGDFKSTRWFVRFDILKAEPVASVQQGFEGGTLGSIAGDLIRSTTGSSVARTVGSSVGAKDAAKVWVIGMRYKVMDASTSEQVTSGYVESKMEVNEQAGKALGLSRSKQQGVTLDSMVQRLVQQAVVRIDRENK